MDSFTNPTSTDTLDSPSHSDQHADANDAIEAIETALGVKYGARVKANRATAQSIGTGSNTAISLNEADSFDTDGFHETVTNPTRVTIPASMGGIYLIVGSVAWAASATGNRILFPRLNGTTALNGTTVNGVATNTLSQTIVDVQNLSAADYIELVVFQSSGGNLNVSSSSLTLIKIA